MMAESKLSTGCLEEVGKKHKKRETWYQRIYRYFTKGTLGFLFKTSTLGKDVRVYRGCCVSDSRMILSQLGLNGNCIFLCNADGNQRKSIKFDLFPLHIALYNSNTVLFSTGLDFIQTINLSDMTPGNKIKVDQECYGMGCKNGKIWINNDRKTLVAIDISGKILTRITTSFDPMDISVHPSGEVYCTAITGESLYAVSPDGKERIVNRNPDLKGTEGIAIDKRGYIYVASKDNNTIHRISPNGADHSIVLTRKDGIKKPTGLAFNEDTSELMVINDDGSSIHSYKA